MSGRLSAPYRWGALWRAHGESYLCYENCMPVLFRTRAGARQWIDEKYGYIRERKDLQVAPHFWKIPIPVVVKVEIAE
jgi:hypothetical protein